MNHSESIAPELLSAIALLAHPVLVLDSRGSVIACSDNAKAIIPGLNIGDSVASLSEQALAAATILRVELPESMKMRSLTQQSKLESLGSIASGVAHDINNIVTGILGHVSYLRIMLGVEGKHCDSLKTIEDGAKRAAALSQQVLRFSKIGDPNPTRIDARAVTASTLNLLKAALPPGCSLTSSLPASGCEILGLETQLSQVVMNLVVNARDAVGPNGVIEVVLSSVTDEEELNRAFRGGDRSSNSYARILVADNGQGMTEEVKRRMFEPYFSTKKALGTGLGLATVNQIIKQFGGAIIVDSSVGRGTTIAVYLPEVSAAPAEGSGIPAVQGGTERILIVDDEYSVRNVLCLSLEHLGYEVVVASGGVEALQLYRERIQPFDLVLLDMLMPDMPGERVFAALQEIDPDVPVMVVSGFAAGPSIQSILEGGGLDYLPKPFTIEELAQKVRGCFAL